MKKLFLVTLLIGSALLAQSQINPGTIYVGASSSGIYQSVKSGNSTVTISNIAVKIGYFAAENLVIGGNIDYSEISSPSSFISGSSTTLGLFTRYYIKGKFFLGANYQSTKSGGASSSLGALLFEGGYAAFLTPNIALEPAITYVTSTDSVVNQSGLGIALGFSLYFNRGE